MNQYVEGFVEQPVVARVGQKAIVYNSKNQILMLRRSAKCDRAGGWDYPGGRLEFGEDPLEGITREIFEEAGLEVRDLKPIHAFSYTNKDDFVVVIGYQACTISDKVTLSWEHDLFRWMSREEVNKLDLPPAHRAFFEHLEM